VVVQTVKVHRHRVMRKMAATSLADLIRMAGQLNVRSGTEAAV
jgi:FixJ family two-component response regulator